MNGEEYLFFDEKAEKKYMFSKENKIPMKYIIEIDKELYTPKSILMDYLFDKDKGLYMFYRQYKEQGQNKIEDILIMLYYSNIFENNMERFFEISKEFIKKSKVTNSNINTDNLNPTDFYLYILPNWKNTWDNLLKKDKEDEEKLRDFYYTINNLSVVEDHEKIFSEIKEISKKKKIKIKKKLDENLSLFLFDSLSCNKDIPLIIKIDENNRQFVKCYTEDNFENKKINDIDFTEFNSCFYIFFNYYSAGENLETYIIYKYDEREIYYNTYKDHNLENIIKKFIYEKIDNEIIFESIIGTSGIINMPFNYYSEDYFVFLIKTDPTIQKFLYIKEYTVRSLKNSLKYYFKNSAESYKNKDKYFMSFTVEKNNLGIYKIKYQTKSIIEKEIKDFAISIAKIIKYYESKLDYIKSFFPLFLLSLEEKENFSSKETKKEGTKLFRLMQANPDMYKEGIYSREICGCKTQPIIIDEEDILDYRNNLIKNKRSEDKRPVILFPPKNSSYFPKHYYTSPSDEYPYISIKKNKNLDGNNHKEFPFLLCCSKTDKLNMVYSEETINKFRENSDYEETIEDVKNMICENEDNLFNKFDIIREGKKVAENKLIRNKNYEIKNTKILQYEKIGNIPLKLENFFKSFGIFKRLGVSEDETKTYDSFISCIMVATENRKSDTYRNEKYHKLLEPFRELYKVNKDTTIEYLKKNFFNLVNETILYQEFIDNKDDIKNFLSSDNFFNPIYYTRLLEEIFDVNIITFSSLDEEVIIEDLKSSNYSIRILDENIPTVFILCKKKNMKSFINTCELLGSSDYVSRFEKNTVKNNLKTFLFDEKITLYVKKYINNYYVHIKNKLYKSPFNYIDWEKKIKSIPGKVELLSQIINSDGKTICINFKVDEEEISFFVLETRPINLPLTDEVFLTTSTFLKKIIKDEGIVGEGGIFYDVNDIKMLLYVPCRDIKYSKKYYFATDKYTKLSSSSSYSNKNEEEDQEDNEEEDNSSSRSNSSRNKSKYNNKKDLEDLINENKTEEITKYGKIKESNTELLICSQYELLKNSKLINKVFKENKQIEFETNVLLQIIFYIYLSNKEDFNRDINIFIKKVFANDRDNIKKIKNIPYIFPHYGEELNIKERVKSFHSYWPDVFGNDGKIHLYDDLIYHVKLFMSYIEKRSDDVDYEPNTSLLGIFNNISDYKKYKNNRIFSSISTFNLWLNSNFTEMNVIKKFIMKSSKMPYFFTNGKNNYLIQGSQDGSLKTAFNYCYNWENEKIVSSYETDIIPYNYVLYKNDENSNLIAFYDKIQNENNFYEIFYHKNGNYSAMLLIN
jgi:hypothetical protein